jgi:hypothetical protein
VASFSAALSVAGKNGLILGESFRFFNLSSLWHLRESRPHLERMEAYHAGKRLSSEPPPQD